MGIKSIAQAPKFAVTPLTDEQIAKAQDLLTENEAAQKALATAAESPYLTGAIGTRSDIDLQLAILEADHALLATAVETGVYDPEAAAQIDIGAIQDKLTAMTPGWNDMNGAITPEDDGTIHLATSGVYDPANPQLSNALAFVVPSGAQKVIGKTVGKDIQVTVVMADQSKKTYTLKNMAVRPEKIYIYGAQKATGLQVDLSGVIRVSDGQYGQPFGETNGFIVWGTEGSDKIIGSQGSDILIGAGGNDVVTGMMGDDQLYGDAFGTGQSNQTDGNDILDGGAGFDTLRAGGGNKDKSIKGAEDNSAEAEFVETETFVEESEASLKEWLKAGQWDTDIDAKTNEITLSLKDEASDGGQIKLTLPDGYTMASGSVDSTGQALIVTMVGFDGAGKPKTLRVRINDFFNPAVQVQLDVNGNGASNILDFHEIALAGNTINLHGAGGNDTILAPKTYLDTLGIDLEALGESSYSKKQLEALVVKLRNTSENALDWGGFAWANATNQSDAAFIQNGEIVLVAPEGTATIDKLAFDLPSGFTDAVLMKDPANPKDLLVVLIERTGMTVNQAVVRIKDGALKADLSKITMDGAQMKYVGAIPVVEGGAGKDTLIGSKSSVNFKTGSGDTLIEGTYDLPSGQQPVNVDTKSEKEQDLLDDKANWEKKANGATAELNALKAKKEKLEEENKKDTSEYQDLLKDIADKEAEIAGYEAKQAKVEKELAALAKG